MRPSEPERIDHAELLRQAIADSDPGDSRAPRAPEPEEIAAHFPDYQILGLIGRGGMGAVYKAIQRRLDRVVALKILAADLAGDPEFGERFLREARTLASLNHPHVLTVHDFGETGGLYYLVTEFVEGVNLRQLMQLGELSPAEALRITPQICDALQYAHEHGVVHRDVKPENILVDTRGQVKIADFGLALLSRPGDRARLTRSSAVFGTPHYMAPESWRGSGSVDHRADIYSLGVVLYEMLTGNLPLGHFDPPSRRPGVPSGLDEVVRRTLAQQPDDRYQHASEVRTDVERQAQTIGPGRTHSPRPKPSGARFSKLPLVALLLVAAGLAGAAALGPVIERGGRAAYEFSSALRRYDASVLEIAEAELRGRPPSGGSAPTLPWPMPEPWFVSVESAKVLIVGLVPAALLLITVLGFWSLRRIRNSDGQLRGMPLALVTAWMVPLAVANLAVVAPILGLHDHDLQIVVLVVAIGAIGAADIWFLVRECRRQQALLDAGTPVRVGGWLLVCGAVLAGILSGGAVGAAMLLPRAQVAARIDAGPTRPQDLVGRPHTLVLDRLGPPLEISASAGGQVWIYHDARGDERRSSLVLSDRTVITHDADAIGLLPNDRAERGPYLGQALQDLVQEIGPPESRSSSTLVTRYSFREDLQVTVHDGLVIGIDRD